MKKIGTVTYNIYCDFTNYGSALQTWALLRSINSLGHNAMLIDYCPAVLSHKHPLNPLETMWDQDEVSRRNCELSLPAIKENYYKFEHFYREVCNISKERYTSENFANIMNNEEISGFVCGSDTIFCIEEFKGFDDGYYANYPVMRGHSVSYSASFGSAEFDEKTYPILNERINNFKALGIREKRMLDYIKEHTSVPCARTIDPTLLLTSHDYDTIAADRQIDEPYLLYYTRRYNQQMEAYAESVANEKGLKFVDISLRATNAEKGHIMRYDAGVEEFLSLVKYSSFIVTNSFHGLIFAVQYKRPVVVYLREQAENKITELLELFGMKESIFVTGNEQYHEIDYTAVHQNIQKARNESLEFLKMELGLL